MNGSSSSVWIQCRQCKHTSRALSVMLNRVLAERRACPQCASVQSPSLQLTCSGSGISLTAAECATLSGAASSLPANRTGGERSGFLQRMWRAVTELGGFLTARA